MTQAIGHAIEIFGFAAVVALVISLVLTSVASRLPTAPITEHFVLSSAVAIGYFVGYLSLPRNWAALVPQENRAWPWLPYLALAAAAFAALPFSKPSLGSTLIMVAIAGIAAAALAPSWPVYGFTRKPLELFVAAYLLAIGIPLQQLPSRLLNRWFLGLLVTVSLLVAVAIGATVSTRLAQLAALAAGANTGAWIAVFVGARDCELALRRLIPVFTALVGGVAWLACVEPDPPQPELLIMPLIPLSIWILAVNPTPFRSSPDRLD